MNRNWTRKIFVTVLLLVAVFAAKIGNFQVREWCSQDSARYETMRTVDAIDFFFGCGSWDFTNSQTWEHGNWLQSPQRTTLQRVMFWDFGPIPRGKYPFTLQAHKT